MNHICIINNIICLCTEHLVRAQHSRYDLLCWRQIISIISQLRGRCGEIQTNWNSFQPQFDGFQNRLKNNYEWCDKKYMKRCVRCRSMPFGSLLYNLCILLFCISFFYQRKCYFVEVGVSLSVCRRATNKTFKWIYDCVWWLKSAKSVTPLFGWYRLIVERLVRVSNCSA